jgi:V/A-type H+-transporting ATPase subunit A
VDSTALFKKQFDLLASILKYRDYAFDALQKGVPIDAIKSTPSKDALAKIKLEEDYIPVLQNVYAQMDAEFKAMK